MNVGCRRYKAMQAALQDLAPLLIRVPLGVIFMAHGLDKWLGTFHGGGFLKTLAAFSQMGMPAPEVSTFLATFGELIGGILMLLGLMTPVGAFMIAVTMGVATFFVHLGGGLFAQDGGFEYTLMLLAASLSVFISGPGKYSLDALLWGCKSASETSCPLD
ncbi:MAG: DoxX family protein [Vampirovibrionales bacterium]|nr:DoxX family protein [Vampirovibrionales bacterium]